MELGIYIHIPFCVKKCDYCDFISYSNCFDMQEKYVEKLLEEIEENKDLLKNNFISTIYIGGGTPSAIKSELIKKILDKIYDVSRIDKEKVEITIEVNPGTTTKSNLQMYRDCGINRLSIGLQSTDDTMLKEIGRIHNYNQFLDTYKWAGEAGFENINVDLMIGLPNQIIKDIKDSLNKIIKLEPEHISVYSLIVEEETPIFKEIQNETLKLPSDELERKMYWYVKDELEKSGYAHYEISNFAKPGFESKHNMNCWKQQEYIGVGAAAHSYTNGVRFSNVDTIEEYISNYEKGKEEDNLIFHEKQNKQSMMKEYMMLGLRKIEGIKIQDFKNKFAENPIFSYRKELEKLVNEELIEIDGDVIKLTKKGLDLANLVWEEFV